MRNILICSLLLFGSAVLPLSGADRAGDPVLWYTHPAQGWRDALPVGNGRLGAMVFGGVGRERIQLNEDTIWNGRKRDRVNPEALKALPEVRRLLFDGRATEAETLEDEKLVGIPHRQPPYRPLGNLDIEFSGLENASDYRRELNLATGIVRVSYRVGGASCTRVASSKKHGHDNRAAGARTGARADWRDIDDGHAGRGSFGDQLFSSSRQS